MQSSPGPTPARHLHLVPDVVSVPAQPNVVARKDPRAAQLCTCAHAREAHDHYRGGSDCGLCSCYRFDRSGPRLAQRVSSTG